jgi:hypothetical protein
MVFCRKCGAGFSGQPLGMSDFVPAWFRLRVKSLDRGDCRHRGVNAMRPAKFVRCKMVPADEFPKGWES